MRLVRSIDTGTQPNSRVDRMGKEIEGLSDTVLLCVSTRMQRWTFVLTENSQHMHIFKGNLLNCTARELWPLIYEHAFAVDIDARRRCRRSRRRRVHTA